MGFDCAVGAAARSTAGRAGVRMVDVPAPAAAGPDAGDRGNRGRCARRERRGEAAAATRAARRPGADRAAAGTARTTATDAGGTGAPRAGAATGAGRGGRRAPRRRAEGGGTAGRSGEAGRGAAQGRGARRAKTCRRGTAEAGGSAGEQRERGGPAAQSRGGGACQGRALDSRAGELGVADRREDHARVAATADGGLDVAEVVQHDLEGSGRFRALPRERMPATPTRADEIAPAVWKGTGSDYVVVGRVTAIDNGQLAVDFDLLNTLTGARLAAQRFVGAASAVRNAAHRVSDVIYQKILGVRGAFATRIAYVAADGSPPAQRYQ